MLQTLHKKHSNMRCASRNSTFLCAKTTPTSNMIKNKLQIDNITNLMDLSGGSFNSHAALHDGVYLTMMEIALRLHPKSLVEAFSQLSLLVRLWGQRILNSIIVMFPSD